MQFSPWIAVYQHRFPDLNLANHRARSGLLTVSNPAPVILTNSSDDTFTLNHIRYTGKEWLRYNLTQQISDVIGIRFSTRFRLSDYDYSIGDYCSFGMGPDWSLSLRYPCLMVMFRAISTEFDGFGFNPGIWYRIEWQWDITGSSKLFINDSLVAYRNDVHPGKIWNVTHLWIGSSEWDLPARPTCFFYGDISYINLQVLRREDAENALTAHIPIDEEDEKKLQKCHDDHQRLVLLIRSYLEDYLQKFIKQESKQWSYNDKDKTPFSKNAIIAHEKALETGNLVMKYLRGEDDHVLSDLLKHLQNFLLILFKFNPELFIEIWNKLKKEIESLKPDEECVKIAKQVEKKSGDQIKRTFDLLSRIIEIIEAIVNQSYRNQEK